MSVNNDLGGQFALDMQGLQRLKHSARQDQSAGLKQAAEQFEALFLQMMLKSMRDASPQSDLMNSQQTEFYNSLLDQQWSQHMAGRGIGLAEQLINQLEGRGAVPQGASNQSQFDELVAGIPRGTPRVLSDAMHGDHELPDDAEETEASSDTVAQGFMGELDARGGGSFLDELDAAMPTESGKGSAVERAASTSDSPAGERPNHVQRFLDTLAAPAQAASRATGVPAELILSQAALETGWGRHEIPTAQGGNSHNLFGIKAGASWQGDTTDITTHEYINGKRTRVSDTFRVYDSFEDSFIDYARLMGDNPRYASVVTAPSAEHAAHALQKAGYATDPGYADKLVSIMGTLGPLQDTDRSLAQSRVISRDADLERSAGGIY